VEVRFCSKYESVLERYGGVRTWGGTRNASSVETVGREAAEVECVHAYFGGLVVGCAGSGAQPQKSTGVRCPHASPPGSCSPSAPGNRRPLAAR